MGPSSHWRSSFGLMAELVPLNEDGDWFSVFSELALVSGAVAGRRSTLVEEEREGLSTGAPVALKFGV